MYHLTNALSPKRVRTIAKMRRARFGVFAIPFLTLLAMLAAASTGALSAKVLVILFSGVYNGP